MSSLAELYTVAMRSKWFFHYSYIYSSIVDGIRIGWIPSKIVHICKDPKSNNGPKKPQNVCIVRILRDLDACKRIPFSKRIKLGHIYYMWFWSIYSSSLLWWHNRWLWVLLLFRFGHISIMFCFCDTIREMECSPMKMVTHPIRKGRISCSGTNICIQNERLYVWVGSLLLLLFTLFTFALSPFLS